MKTKVLWALIALNVILVAGLVFPFGLNRRAHAQVGGGRPADYLMISADVVGASSSIIYVVDETNLSLGAMTLGQNGRTLDVMPPIDLKRVFQAAAPGAGNR